MKIRIVSIACVVLFLLPLGGCTDGDWRAFDDAVHGNSNYKNEKYRMDHHGIIITYGIHNNSRYYYLDNTTEEYCKVRLKLEDGEYEYIMLDPYEETGKRHDSMYNTWKEIGSICGEDSGVFGESFDED